MNSAAQADKNMAPDSGPPFDRLKKICLPDEKKVCLLGFAFGVRENAFHKFSEAGMADMGAISTSLRWGAKCAAGGQVQFVTDSTSLCVHVTLAVKPDMVNMSPIAQCGTDCYLLDEVSGKFVFYSVSKFPPDRSEYTCSLFSGLPRKKRTVLLNLPLYAEVKNFVIGIDPDACILPFTRFRENGRFVFYGTSILQGGCASRPGAMYTNILSRSLEKECLNFGFSGNAFGEEIVARRLAEVENPGGYILDYETNALDKGTLESSLPEFIGILRRTHPETPILVVSGTKQSSDFWDSDFCGRRERAKQFEKNLVNRLRRKGDGKVWFLDFGELFGPSYPEYTVDGIHPSDEGFRRMADRAEKKLRHIQNRKERVRS